MAHLIDKSDLVAEIKSRISDIEVSQKAGLIKKRDADKKILLFKSVLSLIDTLEVKDVDLEKEYKDFIKSDNGRSMFETAKHFFELGLQTQKEPVSEDFEEALSKEWQDYIDRGAATVDALEDNTQELAFAKGFNSAWSYKKEEPVSIDLEKAAKDYSWAINKQVEIIKKEITTDAEITEIDIKNAYIAGADWQRRKMMGIDSYIEGPKGGYTTTTK